MNAYNDQRLCSGPTTPISSSEMFQEEKGNKNKEAKIRELDYIKPGSIIDSYRIPEYILVIVFLNASVVLWCNCVIGQTTWETSAQFLTIGTSSCKQYKVVWFVNSCTTCWLLNCRCLCLFIFCQCLVALPSERCATKIYSSNVV